MIEKRNKSGSFGLLQRARKFVELREWLNDRVTLDTYNDPLNSIMLVDDTTLSVASPMHSMRFVYITPLVLALWGLLFYVASDFLPSNSEVTFANRMIERKQEFIEAGRSFDNTDFLYYESLVGKDGKSSLFEYLHTVKEYSSERYRSKVFWHIVIIFSLLALSICGTIAFFRLPRVADLYFDRQRQIVYTWRWGKVAACHFDNLGYRESSYGLDFILYSEHKKKQFWPARFGFQPTGRAHFNNESDNTELMAQIFAFMDKGKSAVIKGERFVRPQPKYYFYIDEKPENFERRVQEILGRDHELPDLYTQHLI
ncbi:hypothetical protein [Vibrio japonicus]|uniref:Uncharacterized protein n=1 Tax=Vibrio japonicus TaxID=1824638 RepID=A0ABY5LPC1_9VIBR|nr:hypothetical protein [Vibrio japonicus]UUM31580.1 hypothetical protein NP165_05460 [Vibrio japonicus]